MVRVLKTLLVAGILGLMAQGVASAGQFEKFNEEAFKKAQAEGQPILVEIDAGWCPICAKQRPIIDRLTEGASLKDVKIMVVSFDGQKGVVRSFNATMQSTLIAFHGAQETGRLVGETDTQAIQQLLQTTKG
ncbi:MAG TPA: thioredoxin family protein [Magnetospirillaceae bacterium]|jgi:thioredoxin-like negative regulator of GroEL